MDPSTQRDQSKTTERAANLAQDIREEGREHLDSTRRTAAAQVEGMADAVHAARDQLDQSQQPTLARYTANLANGMERVAVRLRDASLEDLARDARTFAARNPALFVLGSAAAGVILARFLKVSTPRSEGARTDSGTRDYERSEAAFADARQVSPSEVEPPVVTGTPPH